MRVAERLRSLARAPQADLQTGNGRIRGAAPAGRPSSRFARMPGEPWAILVPLLVAQWAAVATFALLVPRNGWLFYQGGDQTWFYTSAWVLSGGHIPETLVGPTWALLQTPFAALFGPSFLSAVPAVLLFQFVFLVPLALLSVYGIASRIGGRLLGYWAASLWIVVPYLAVPFFVGRYQPTYVEQVLPQSLGLTGLGDFPSMVALLGAAYFTLRALQTHSPTDAVAAGLIAGIAIGIKPSNGLFLFAPVAAFAVSRRWREVVAFGIALLPALVTLVLWKHRGSGIALLANEPIRLASGLLGAQDYTPPTFWERLQEYVPLDRHELNRQFLGFREYLWSARLLEFGAVAGVLATLRRSGAIALFLAVWLAAFFAVKGSSPAVSVETGSFFRLLMPAFPAYFLMVAALPLLVPVLGRRLAEWPAPAPRRFTWRHPAFVAAAVTLVVLPLVALTVLPSESKPVAAKVPLRSLFLPIDESFAPSVEAVEGGLRITWPPYPGSHADVFYVLYRSPLQYVFPATGLPVSQGLMCRPSSGAIKCTLEMDEVERGRERELMDQPGAGAWTYRIGVAANWQNDPEAGDVFVVSAPLNVSVG